MPRPKLAADLNTVLTRYAWPGNVRRLKNAIYRALTQLDGYELRPQDILLPDYDATVAVGEDAMEGSLDEITSRFQRFGINPALSQLSQHAQTGKTSRHFTLHNTENKFREYGLSQKKNEE